MKQQFIHEYTRDFDIILKETMTPFLGLEIEQGSNGIDLRLDTYIKETITDYWSYFKTFLKPKKVPMQPGVVLDGRDCPEMPDPRMQKIYRSIVAKLRFASSWVRCDTAFVTSQLARFCASAGPTHFAALEHLMGYLIGNTGTPSTVGNAQGLGIPRFWVRARPFPPSIIHAFVLPLAVRNKASRIPGCMDQIQVQSSKTGLKITVTGDHQQTGVLLYHIIFILLYYTHYDTIISYYDIIISLIFLQMSGLLFFIISLSPKGLLYHL